MNASTWAGAAEPDPVPAGQTRPRRAFRSWVATDGEEMMCPALITVRTPPHRKGTLMPVVVGYIPTPEGRAALAAAEDEARRRATSLVVVHSSRGGADEQAEQVATVQDDLDAIRGRLSGDGVTVDVRDLALGREPVDDLLAVASEVQADVIVIGLRRRSPVGKLILGSNSQHILLTADCPVLAVKATPGH
ncbi:MAG TPA: universal stress protein [Kineosporiaceae bacterium]|nr:universal stress protein [Kineosporiaceae bacterium]